MNTSQTGNNHSNSEELSNDILNREFSKQQSIPHHSEQDTNPVEGIGHEKDREDQVLAKINGDPDNKNNTIETEETEVTNDNSRIINEFRKGAEFRSIQKSIMGYMVPSQLMRLFEDELKDIYWAELATTKAIPRMIQSATSAEVIEALSSHLNETHLHVERLAKVFASIEKKPIAVKCVAMEGLLKEAEFIIEACDAGAMRDAGIISAAQKIEHYEIASYGTMRMLAETLMLTEAFTLLSETLEEEYKSDELLTGIATGVISVKATGQIAELY